MKVILLFVLYIAAILADYTSYDGYIVYSATPVTKDDAILLHELEESGHYDFWTPVRRLNHPVNIMVPPYYKETFTSTLASNNIQYSVLIDDVEAVVNEERLHQTRAPRAATGRINFEAYQRYNSILDYLTTLGEDYPSTVSVEDYGTSYEGRPLRLIRVGTNITDTTKPTILIEGGIHAREWIAPALVLYIIQELVENSANVAMIEDVNWIIIPVTNPDGYEFSHTNSRMWRKTRSIGTICNGADGNRNFDCDWGGLGTSSSECSEIYTGRYPFSEVECAAFAEVALAAENVVLYLAVHSFGNWILYPWGYTLEPADNRDELQNLGDLVAASIASVFQTQYTVGNSAELLYFAAGASDDWCKGVAGIPLSYTLELPGGGSQGFDLPPSRIAAVVQESFEGIKTYYQYVTGQIAKGAK